MLVAVAQDAGVLDVLAQRYRAAFDKTKAGRAQWIEGTLELAKVLLEGRVDLPSHHDFKRWLERHNLQEMSKDDRWALLNMAEHSIATRKELEQSDTTSWLQIWRKMSKTAPRRLSKGRNRRKADYSGARKRSRIPDVMREDNPKPERKAVILKALTQEEVDPDFKGTPLQFATENGHVPLQTKQEVRYHKQQEVLMAWIGTMADHERTARAMLATIAAVDPKSLSEWMSKPTKAEKLRGWCKSVHLACDALETMMSKQHE